MEEKIREQFNQQNLIKVDAEYYEKVQDILEYYKIAFSMIKQEIEIDEDAQIKLQNISEYLKILEKVM